MAEEVVQTPADPKPFVPTKVGKPTVFKTGLGQPSQQNPTDNNGGQQQQAAPAASGEDTTTQSPAQGGGTTNKDNGTADPVKPPVEISEDALRAWAEKEGIPFESLDSFKSKLKDTPKELTPEQKAAVEKAKEQKMVKAHLDRGGKVEEYSALKEALSIDKKVLGLEAERKDLLENGYTREAADERIKAKYDQYTDDEINSLEGEDKEQAIKDRNMGNKKLERKGEYWQNKAKEHFNILEQEIAEQDADLLHTEQHSSKVEDAVKKFARKETFKLTQADGTELPSAEFEFSDTAINSAKEILKDFSGFKKQLLTDDGHVNFDFILPHLIRSFSAGEMMQKGFLTGQDRAVKFFKSKFGDVIPDLGGSHKPSGTPGQLVSAGKPVKTGRPVFK